MNWALHDDVLDPGVLLGHLERLRQHRQQNAPGDGVSVADLDEIQANLSEALATPRAAYPASTEHRPPPVVHLPAHAATSMFQSVIAHCVEPLLPTDDVGERAPLEHWAAKIKDLFRRFGPCDPGWIEPRLHELLTHSNHPFVEPPSEPAELADEARVILVGDWATGLPQAINVAARIRELLQTATATDRHVIHLGDTYYSGLREEYEHRFLPQWPVDPGSDVRSWSLNGNHDMYSGGHGYFQTLLADSRFQGQRGSSNFWLRNDHWQIVGLDSAHASPDNPTLAENQKAWLRRLVDDGKAASRQTIILSHHQPFTAYDDKRVTGAFAKDVATALNGTRVAAWFWGHEHRCTVYRRDVTAANYNQLAAYTATVGHGGVPTLIANAAGPQVQIDDEALLDPGSGGWVFDGTYTVEDATWALGGFAVLSFDRQNVEIDYIDENGDRRHGPTAIAPVGI